MGSILAAASKASLALAVSTAMEGSIAGVFIEAALRGMAGFVAEASAVVD